MIRPTHFWIFQSNPLRYRIEAAVAEREADAWPTRGRDIRRGDRAAIWKAKGNDPVRGVIAFGEVMSDPELMIDTENDPYWLEPRATGFREERVLVRYLPLPHGPLWLGGPADAALRGLVVSRVVRGSVFPIAPEKWAVLLAAAGGWPEP